MKQKIFVKFAAFALIGLMVSCSTSNDVANNRGIQKRKYTKGYFFDFNKKLSGVKDADQVAQNDGGESIPETAVREVPKTIVTEVSNVEQTIEMAEVFTVSTEENTIHAVAENKQENKIDKLDFEESTKGDLKIIKSEMKFMKNKIRHKKATVQSSEASDDAILYYILAILIPFLAVGLVTDWDITKVIICLLLSFLFWIPGVIYALIVVSKNV